MAPLARFDKLDPEKRAAILEAATAEFATHGYDGASINRVVAAAGISKGAVYYYFEDKADLFATVLESLTADGLDWIVALDAADADAFWTILRDLLSRNWAYARENPHFLELGRVFAQLPREMWFEGRIGAFMQRHVGDLARIIAHGQSLGAVRDDLPPEVLMQLAMALGEAFDRWLLAEWETRDDAGRARLYRTGLENLQRLLLPFPPDMFDAWHPPEDP